MHRVGVDAQGRVRCIISGWMHRVGVDAQGRGGMPRVGVGCIWSGWDA